jgi:hypothetical protein
VLALALAVIELEPLLPPTPTVAVLPVLVQVEASLVQTQQPASARRQRQLHRGYTTQNRQLLHTLAVVAHSSLVLPSLAGAIVRQQRKSKIVGCMPSTVLPFRSAGDIDFVVAAVAGR